MGTVTFLAPANPQWVWLELEMICVLRRLMGNDSTFGWCDFITLTEPRGLARNSAIISGRSSV
jgi:hypothetical protein